MCPCSGFVSAAAFIVSCIAVFPAVTSQFNVTEPGRLTHIYGQEFVVVVPLTSGLPEDGSSLQIACVSCQRYNSYATGSVTLLQGNFSENFTVHAALPVFVSLRIAELEALAGTPGPAILNVTANESITVTVLVQISSTLQAYTAFPVQAQDRYYVVASYEMPEGVSELTVVATEPDVYFSLKPYGNVTILGHEDLPAKTQFERGVGGWVTYRTNGSFMGAHLVGEKPVQGIVGTHPASSEAQSLDRLYPLVSLGTSYTAVPVAGEHLRNVFRVVPVWDDTNLTVSVGRPAGGAYRPECHTLHGGQTLDVNCGPGEVGRFEGSKPFLLLHHVEFGTPVVDAAVVSVPPAEQFTRQSFTLSTYQLDTQVDTYVSIVAPCKHWDQVWLQRTAGGASPLKLEAKRSIAEDEQYCGSSRHLEAGVYSVGLDPESPPEAVYSAVLYGKTSSGVFAYVVASELSQVTCSVDHAEVTLCPARVPIQPVSSTLQPVSSTLQPVSSTLQTATVPTSTAPKNNNNGTVIGAVIAVVSIGVGLIILGCCLYRYRGQRWKRLDESEYLEDNPIRMNTITAEVSGL